MAKGTWKVTIEKFLNGSSYGIDEYFIDGTFVSDFNEAVIRALDEAQCEGMDEFDYYEIVDTEFEEDF